MNTGSTPRRVVGLFEIVDRGYERFRNIPSAEHTESIVLRGCHVWNGGVRDSVAKGAHSFVILDARSALHSG